MWDVSLMETIDVRKLATEACGCLCMYGGTLCVSLTVQLIDWISDTLSQGYIDSLTVV